MKKATRVKYAWGLMVFAYVLINGPCICQAQPRRHGDHGTSSPTALGALSGPVPTDAAEMQTWCSAMPASAPTPTGRVLMSVLTAQGQAVEQQQAGHFEQAYQAYAEAFRLHPVASRLNELTGPLEDLREAGHERLCAALTCLHVRANDPAERSAIEARQLRTHCTEPVIVPTPTPVVVRPGPTGPAGPAVPPLVHPLPHPTPHPPPVVLARRSTAGYVLPILSWVLAGGALALTGYSMAQCGDANAAIDLANHGGSLGYPVDAYNQAHRWCPTANASLGVGIAFLVAAPIAWLTMRPSRVAAAPNERSPLTALTLFPTIAPGQAGLSARLTF